MQTDEKVKQILRKQLSAVTLEEMNEDASLVKDLGADSLDMELIRCDLQEEFDVEITDELAERLITVGDLIRYASAAEAR